MSTLTAAKPQDEELSDINLLPDFDVDNEDGLTDSDEEFDYDGFETPQVTSWPHVFKSVRENGQLIQKPALECMIDLKDEPPEGCDHESFRLRFLEKVTSDPASAYIRGSNVNAAMFTALLTEDEYAKLSGMDEVAEAVQLSMKATEF